MLFCILKPSLYQVGLTFVVGDAIVKALCSIWSCGSVEGLNRERAGWWGLCPVLKQCLFYKSKLNDVILQFITFRGSFSPIKHGLPSSWRRYWFPPRSLANDQASPSSLSQNSTTLFLSSCTQVPSELTTWYTNNTLYPHSHTLNTCRTEHIRTLCHPLTIGKTVITIFHINPNPSMSLLHKQNHDTNSNTVDH